MFVIVQAWEMTKAQTEDLPMPERIGKMMKNAGVSITVTSLTDILAFGIGATTVSLCCFYLCERRFFFAFGIGTTFASFQSCIWYWGNCCKPMLNFYLALS